MEEFPEDGERRFLDSVKSNHAEFESLYTKAVGDSGSGGRLDLFQFIMENSEFLGREENKWMLI